VTGGPLEQHPPHQTHPDEADLPSRTAPLPQGSLALSTETFLHAVHFTHHGNSYTMYS